MIEKLASIKTLKEISLELGDIDDETLATIKDKNYSVSKMLITWKNRLYDCFLNNLISIFQNLTTFKLIGNVSKEKSKPENKIFLK